MRQVRDYAGARGAIKIADVSRLSPRRYALQPKMDGAYCAVRLDHAGRVAQITSRTGADYGRIVDSFRGIYLGAPGSVFAGELEGHTESGIDAAERRGWANIHLFDVLRLGDRDLAAEPYRMRRDALYRAHSEIASPEYYDGVYDRMRRSYRGQDGRYRARPMDWRRFEIVPQMCPSSASDLWDLSIAGKLEGLVVVDLDAPLGRRNGKRKCKPVDTIDARVIEVKSSTVTVRSFCGVVCVARGRRDIAVGDIVEIVHNGHYADGTPRFARLHRMRHDLAWPKPKQLCSTTLARP